MNTSCRFKSIMILSFLSAAAIFLLIPSMGETATARTYIVKRGDNLYKISKRYRVSVEEIKEVNRLDSTSLRAGMRLNIPAGTRESVKGTSLSVFPKASGHSEHAATAIDASRPGEGSMPSTNPRVRYHTIRKGETLTSISRKYSLSIKDLSELNGIRNKSGTLRPGRKLIVGRASPATYTVKNGDDISKIADKFDVAVEDLMDINGLESPEVRTGQELLLEASVDGRDATGSEMSTPTKISQDIRSIEASQDLKSLSVKERLILFARKMLNIPYRFGGSTLMGIDCSGYVQKVFGLLDVTLPRTAREQFHLGEPVNKEDLTIGDLVFFRTYASFPSHVGIYLGNNLFIHASSKSRKVSIDSLDTPYYFKRFIGAKRLFDDELQETLEQTDRS